jgi:hypothetical protein
MYIRREDLLEAIVKGLESAPLQNGEHIGHFIRHVDVDIINDNPEDRDTLRPLSSVAQSHIIRILSHATNLQWLRICNIFEETLLAIPTLHSSARSLRRLEVELDTDSADINESLVAIPKYINRFVHLTRLVLRCHTDWPNSHTRELSLPQLEVLFFSSHKPNRDIRSAWLARCRFQKLSVLAVLFTDPQHFGSQASQHILQFLEHHRDICILSLQVPIKCFRRVMTQLDPSVTVLDFSDHPLLDTMLDNIPLSVSELAVFCTEKAEDAAWRALEKLAKVDLRIRRIHIGMRSTTSKFFPPFTWAAGLASIYDTTQADQPLSIFTTHMLLVAVKLLSKRIDLVDAEGRSASLVFVQGMSPTPPLCGTDLFV